MMAESDEQTLIGLKVPRGLLKPVTNVATSFLAWLAGNPALVLILLVGGGLGYGGHQLFMYAVETAVPAFIEQIQDGQQAAADKFIEANQQTRSDFARDLRAVTDRFVEDRERDRVMIREIREMLKESRAARKAEDGKRTASTAGTL